jgi:hypothetical protein
MGSTLPITAQRVLVANAINAVIITVFPVMRPKYDRIQAFISKATKF